MAPNICMNTNSDIVDLFTCVFKQIERELETYDNINENMRKAIKINENQKLETKINKIRTQLSTTENHSDKITKNVTEMSDWFSSLEQDIACTYEIFGEMPKALENNFILKFEDNKTLLSSLQGDLLSLLHNLVDTYETSTIKRLKELFRTKKMQRDGRIDMLDQVEDSFRSVSINTIEVEKENKKLIHEVQNTDQMLANFSTTESFELVQKAKKQKLMVDEWEIKKISFLEQIEKNKNEIEGYKNELSSKGTIAKKIVEIDDEFSKTEKKWKEEVRLLEEDKHVLFSNQSSLIKQLEKDLISAQFLSLANEKKKTILLTRSTKASADRSVAKLLSMRQKNNRAIESNLRKKGLTINGSIEELCSGHQNDMSLLRGVMDQLIVELKEIVERKNEISSFATDSEIRNLNIKLEMIKSAVEPAKSRMNTRISDKEIEISALSDRLVTVQGIVDDIAKESVLFEEKHEKLENELHKKSTKSSLVCAKLNHEIEENQLFITEVRKYIQKLQIVFDKKFAEKDELPSKPLLSLKRSNSQDSLKSLSVDFLDTVKRAKPNNLDDEIIVPLPKKKYDNNLEKKSVDLSTIKNIQIKQISQFSENQDKKKNYEVAEHVEYLKQYQQEQKDQQQGQITPQKELLESNQNLFVENPIKRKQNDNSDENSDHSLQSSSINTISSPNNIQPPSKSIVEETNQSQSSFLDQREVVENKLESKFQSYVPESDEKLSIFAEEAKNTDRSFEIENDIKNKKENNNNNNRSNNNKHIEIVEETESGDRNSIKSNCCGQKHETENINVHKVENNSFKLNSKKQSPNFRENAPTNNFSKEIIERNTIINPTQITNETPSDSTAHRTTSRLVILSSSAASLCGTVQIREPDPLKNTSFNNNNKMVINNQPNTLSKSSDLTTDKVKFQGQKDQTQHFSPATPSFCHSYVTEVDPVTPQVHKSIKRQRKTIGNNSSPKITDSADNYIESTQKTEKTQRISSQKDEAEIINGKIKIEYDESLIKIKKVDKNSNFEHNNNNNNTTISNDKPNNTSFNANSVNSNNISPIMIINSSESNISNDNNCNNNNNSNHNICANGKNSTRESIKGTNKIRNSLEYGSFKQMLKKTKPIPNNQPSFVNNRIPRPIREVNSRKLQNTIGGTLYDDDDNNNNNNNNNRSNDNNDSDSHQNFNIDPYSRIEYTYDETLKTSPKNSVTRTKVKRAEKKKERSPKKKKTTMPSKKGRTKSISKKINEFDGFEKDEESCFYTESKRSFSVRRNVKREAIATIQYGQAMAAMISSGTARLNDRINGNLVCVQRL